MNECIWKDLLTKVGDETISYDKQGNPTSYLGHTLTWEKGRQLKSFGNLSYTYNANGIRTSKTNNGVKHTYTLEGTKILRETYGNTTLVPMYDNEDSICGIIYNNVPYYFRKNLQGDIIAIVDKDAKEVARYSYDAWGACTVVSASNVIGYANPFRYRGYYYDIENNLYYLNNRYYNPNIGRFLNTDKYIGVNNDISTYDLYSYCGNCPINRYDKGGLFWTIIENGFKWIVRNTLNQTNEFFLTLGIDTAGLGAKVLDMYEKNGTYHASKDCWQQYFGYNDLYDIAFDIGTSMAKDKFPFNYNNKNYIFGVWKGSYVNLGAGAELGIYYGGPYHWFVDTNLSMFMTLELKYNGKQIISHYERTWWITGFNPKYLYVSADELQATYTVTFDDKNMYKKFKEGPKADKWTYTFPPCYNKTPKARLVF